MIEFKRGDWFQFKPEFEPEHTEIGEKFQVNSVAFGGTLVSYLDPDCPDWQQASTDHIVKVADPNPKLTAALNRTPPFAKPYEVEEIFRRAEEIIHPKKINEGDWEILHSKQEDLFEDSFQVMLDHKDYREEILRKMLEVTALQIPRW